MKSNHHSNTVPLSEITKDFTPADWKQVELEKRYYYLITALYAERKRLGLTQAQLSELSKIPRTTISKIESGSRNVTLQTLETLTEAMGKTLELTLK